MRSKIIESIILASIFIFVIWSAVLISKVSVDHGGARDSHLAILANQFLRGRVFLPPLGLPEGDIVHFQNNYYLYFGPMPEVLLMPLAIISGRDAPQQLLGYAAIVVSLLAVYKICQKLGFSRLDRLWLAMFFVFSTALFFVGIINISAYQVQAVGTTFVLLALLEFLGKKRPLLIGFLVAAAGLSRATLFLSAIFFLLAAIREKKLHRHVLLLLLPIIISLVLLGAYNFKRFRSVSETGYGWNVTLETYPMSENYKFGGQFNLSYLPTNLYSLLVRSPEPLARPGGFIVRFPYLKVSPWGIAIWFTSPLLLYLIKAKRESYTVPAMMTILALSVPILLYFGIGFSQFGYRYALDFLPFLFLILVSGLKPRLTLIAKTLIVLGILFSCLYMASIWGYYPHFGIYVATDKV